MNKLAVLAFALLLFFSTMSWYLANGSLNDYLKSQVILQSEYYSAEPAELVSANFSEATGITTFNKFSLNNLAGLTQQHVLTINSISAQLAETPIKQLDAPSIQKKTTTLVHIKELRLKQVNAWSEMTQIITNDAVDKTNIELILDHVNTTLAKDYPALYPQLGAKIYAQEHPERSEELALAERENKPTVNVIETNKAIIASNEAKQKKRLLGKASTRVKISNVIIGELTLTIIIDNGNKAVIGDGNNKTITKHFKNISLGSFGDDNGLASNQMGGELLKQLLSKLISIEKSNTMDDK